VEGMQMLLLLLLNITHAQLVTSSQKSSFSSWYTKVLTNHKEPGFDAVGNVLYASHQQPLP
jgi:hypothetical protein